jgi:galactose mutarotase-like enzyme
LVTNHASAKDPGHPVYNSIPGRYVNRIGKATYTIDNVTYHTEVNDGVNTLHSGTNNWSYRFWNVTKLTTDSITFNISDASNSSLGMIGLVNASVTYSVSNSTWKITMHAISPEAKTPLMLTQHTYLNLDAYRNPATDTIWDHTLSLPYSPRYLELDDGALPTGKILTAAPGSVNDFASSPNISFGHAVDAAGFKGNCGGTCAGYNGYWIFDNAPKDAAVLTLASEFTGIKAELRTDQPGVQVYSCYWSDGTAPLKRTQGTATHKNVTSSSCVAIEAQDYVDGINQ